MTSSKTPINEIRIPIIIETIKSLGGDPLNTAANSGIPGIKKMVRNKLKGHPDFVSDKAFDNAWQAARNEGKIK